LLLGSCQHPKAYPQTLLPTRNALERRNCFVTNLPLLTEPPFGHFFAVSARIQLLPQPPTLSWSPVLPRTAVWSTTWQAAPRTLRPFPTPSDPSSLSLAKTTAGFPTSTCGPVWSTPIPSHCPKALASYSSIPLGGCQTKSSVCKQTPARLASAYSVCLVDTKTNSSADCCFRAPLPVRCRLCHSQAPRCRAVDQVLVPSFRKMTPNSSRLKRCQSRERPNRIASRTLELRVDITFNGLSEDQPPAMMRRFACLTRESSNLGGSFIPTDSTSGN